MFVGKGIFSPSQASEGSFLSHKTYQNVSEGLGTLLKYLVVAPTVNLHTFLLLNRKLETISLVREHRN